MAKRVIVISDTHCGHRIGLTPPKEVREKLLGKEEASLLDLPGESKDADYKWAYRRRLYWEWFSKTVDKYRPFDAAIHLGDAVEGQGPRGASEELITASRDKQALLAITVLRFLRAPKYHMVFGTPYHVGIEENWEQMVATDIGAVIGNHDQVDVNGLILDLKHHIGGSEVPHGRHTAISRERVWNLVWSQEKRGYERADVLLRGHVHYHIVAGGPGWLSIIAPALQGTGTEFGARRKSGTVDFGFLVFDITSKEDFQWKAVTYNSPSTGAGVRKL